MTKKKSESETAKTAETVETAETAEPGTAISVKGSDVIEETPAETLPPVTLEGEEAGSEGAGSAEQ